jgi:hypothetical protein
MCAAYGSGIDISTNGSVALAAPAASAMPAVLAAPAKLLTKLAALGSRINSDAEGSAAHGGRIDSSAEGCKSRR